MANTPPDSNESAATNRAGAPRQSSPKPSFSQFGHWVWLNQRLTDAGYRYYSAIRSYIFDADEEFEVDITDEVIAELLGKSAKSISRARRDCYDAGVIEELAFWKESVRVEDKSKPEVRTFRRLIVHHEVPDGYEGPVNAYREKRSIEKRRSQEQAEARAARVARQQESTCDRTDVSPHSDQGKRGQHSESPAQCDRTDLSGVGTDLSGVGTDLSLIKVSDLQKQVANLPYHLPSHQPTTASDEAASADAVGSSTDGWMVDGSAEEETPQPALEVAGAVLLRQATAANGQSISPEAVEAWNEFVNSLLTAGYPANVITRHLTEGARGPGFIIRKLEKLHRREERLPNTQTETQQQTPVGPRRWCGDCNPSMVLIEGRKKPVCASACSHAPADTREQDSVFDDDTDEVAITAAEAADFMARLAAVN